MFVKTNSSGNKTKNGEVYKLYIFTLNLCSDPLTKETIDRFLKCNTPITIILTEERRIPVEQSMSIFFQLLMRKITLKVHEI